MDKIFPAVVVALCVVMLVRLALGDRRRYLFDRTVARWSRIVRAKLERVFTWNAGRRRARRVADEAIRRAREGPGEWDGNVYRPKSFKKKDRKIH